MQPQDSAQQRVLWTTDTLELVLVQLDIQTLLLAQRTCRLWHSLITTSPSIQKALFYLPRDVKKPIYNPILAKAFPAFFPHPTTGMTDAHFTFMTFDSIQNPDKIIAYNRREASWRRMLVRQPPPTNFAFIDVVLGTTQDPPLRRKIIQPHNTSFAPSKHGLCMEVLYQFVVTGGNLKFEADHYHRIHWSSGASTRMVRHPWRGRSEVGEALQQTLAEVDLVIHSRRPRNVHRTMLKPDTVVEEKRRRLIMPHYADPTRDIRLYTILNWEFERNH